MIKKIISKNNLFWFLILVFSFIGIMSYTLISFVPGIAKERLEFKIYLKFTFQSNLFGFILASLMILNKKSMNVQRFKILTLASLTITGIVFWAVLFPKRGISHYNIFTFIITIIVHAVVPILMIVAFWLENKNKQNDIKLSIWKNIFLLIIYPILWLIMAIIVYYVFNHHIYSFLDFKNQSVIKSLIYVISIALIFILFSFIYIHLNNRFVSKINVKK